MTSKKEALRNGNSSVNQRIKSEFINKHVYSNANSMVEYILSKGYEEDGSNVPFSWDDVTNQYYYEYQGHYITLDNASEEGRDQAIEKANVLLSKQNDKLDILNSKLEELDTDKDNNETNTLKENIADIESKISAMEDEIYDVENIEGQQTDVFEWYTVSNFLSKKLQEHNEPIIEDENIWGRCTTGQAILLDYVITKICADMEVLEGQANSWE